MRVGIRHRSQMIWLIWTQYSQSTHTLRRFLFIRITSLTRLKPYIPGYELT